MAKRKYGIIIYCPGFKAAIKDLCKKSKISLHQISKEIGINYSTLLGINNNISQLYYERIIKIFPKPWKTPYCELSQRTRYYKEIECEEEDDEEDDGYITRYWEVKTPNLDEFNGVEGGWC